MEKHIVQFVGTKLNKKSNNENIQYIQILFKLFSFNYSVILYI